MNMIATEYGIASLSGRTLRERAQALIEEHPESGPAGYPAEVLKKSSRNHHFAFEVEDATAAAEHLKSLGIELIDDAKQRPDGAIQTFVADPDGHVVELCTSPRAGGSGLIVD